MLSRFSGVAVAKHAVSVRALATSTAVLPRGADGKIVDNLGSYDDPHVDVGDVDKREFTYLVLGGARFMYASAVRLTVMKFVASMSASADVLALASLEVDLEKISMGNTATVKWRGKPVFVRHRTDKEITTESHVDPAGLRDPQTDAQRVKDPRWLVALGVCTHLGCVPIPNAGEYHGFFCPCHGSHYDASGRIRKGPAPLNLEIPPYKFFEETKVLIG